MARRTVLHANSGRVLRVISVLLFAPAIVSSLLAQATPCCNPPTTTWNPQATPVNNVPTTGNSWSPTSSTFPNSGASWEPQSSATDIGRILNAPNASTQPSIEQRAWYVNSHPDLRTLDPGIKQSIIYSGAGSGLLNGPYLPNGRPNPFVSPTNPYVVQSNWYLPSTWSSPYYELAGCSVERFSTKPNRFCIQPKLVHYHIQSKFCLPQLYF